MTKEKKTYLLKYAGQQQRFARSVVAEEFVFLSGSSGRTLETGEDPRTMLGNRHALPWTRFD